MNPYEVLKMGGNHSSYTETKQTKTLCLYGLFVSMKFPQGVFVVTTLINVVVVPVSDGSEESKGTEEGEVS